MIKRQLLVLSLVSILPAYSFAASNIAIDALSKSIQNYIAKSDSQIEHNDYIITGKSYAGIGWRSMIGAKKKATPKSGKDDSETEDNDQSDNTSSPDVNPEVVE